MSIERIKELKNKLVTAMCISTSIDVDTANLLASVADYLIEQEEQKVPYALPKWSATGDQWNVSELTGVNDACLGDAVVEAGQIWRGIVDGLLIEIVREYKPSQYSEVFISYKHNDEPRGKVSRKVLLELFELVTMDNIKEGEWLFDAEYNVYKQVKTNFDGEITFIDDSQPVPNKWAPCLPPTEKEPVKSDRLEYVEEVISRFNLIGTEVPQEWVKERDELTAQVNEGLLEKRISDTVDDIKGSNPYKFTQKDMDEAREEGYSKAEELYKKQYDELAESALRQVEEAVKRTIRIYKKK